MPVPVLLIAAGVAAGALGIALLTSRRSQQLVGRMRVPFAPNFTYSFWREGSGPWGKRPYWVELERDGLPVGYVGRDPDTDKLRFSDKTPLGDLSGEEIGAEPIDNAAHFPTYTDDDGRKVFAVADADEVHRFVWARALEEEVRYQEWAQYDEVVASEIAAEDPSDTFWIYKIYERSHAPGLGVGVHLFWQPGSGLRLIGAWESDSFAIAAPLAIKALERARSAMWPQFGMHQRSPLSEAPKPIAPELVEGFGAIESR